MVRVMNLTVFKLHILSHWKVFRDNDRHRAVVAYDNITFTS
jgi:hypothetical protein